jgi:DNA polymerase Ligase (LigD)
MNETNTTMTSKRPASPGLIPNPFIKKRNLEWAIQPPTLPPISSETIETVTALVTSPPSSPPDKEPAETTTTAAIEAGEVKITDHTSHFSALLSSAILSPYPPDVPHLPIDVYRRSYERSFGSKTGAHFVIHQHDHPIAGTHYDLRLQINESSSVSWAIMYGLPGDPNSVRLNRNATETRVHCLWVRTHNPRLVGCAARLFG